MCRACREGSGCSPVLGSACKPEKQGSRMTWLRGKRVEHLQEVRMDKGRFMKSGHFPTLLAAFLYFDVSFMVWVLLGPLAPFLGEQLHLTATQKGLLTAIPLLGGSLFRPVL